MKIYPVTLSGGWQKHNGEPFWRWSGLAEAPTSVRGIAFMQENGRMRVAASGMDGVSRLPIELTAVPLDDRECQLIFSVGHSRGLLRTMIQTPAGKTPDKVLRFDLKTMKTAEPGFFAETARGVPLRFGAAFVGEKYYLAAETGHFEREMLKRAEGLQDQKEPI